MRRTATYHARVGPDPGAESSGASARPRRRRRLSRTLSRSRFRDYRTLLRTALTEDYAVVSLEAFLAGAVPPGGERVLILRHDVDQHPASALAMAAIERELGLRSTWYLRWRAADPGVVEALLATGGEIGLHYETLTRRVLADGLGPDDDLEGLLDPCRAELRGEIAAFSELFGPIRGVSAHGDTRAPWARNLRLLDGEDLAGYGVQFDANLAMRRHALAIWLTDRSTADGSWNEHHEPLALLRDGVSPIQCLTHPNNWAGGPRLWLDRALAAALPAARPGARLRIRRSRSDRPAQPSAASGAS